jgi:hypothetical protein
MDWGHPNDPKAQWVGWTWLQDFNTGLQMEVGGLKKRRSGILLPLYTVVVRGTVERMAWAAIPDLCGL